MQVTDHRLRTFRSNRCNSDSDSWAYICWKTDICCRLRVSPPSAINWQGASHLINCKEDMRARQFVVDREKTGAFVEIRRYVENARLCRYFVGLRIAYLKKGEKNKLLLEE